MISEHLNSKASLTKGEKRELNEKARRILIQEWCWDGDDNDGYDELRLSLKFDKFDTLLYAYKV